MPVLSGFVAEHRDVIVEEISDATKVEIQVETLKEQKQTRKIEELLSGELT